METSNLPSAYAAVLTERRDVLREQLSAILSPQQPRFLLEVGCGHGHFLQAYAAAHPDTLCIGVDMESDRIARATKKRDRARLPNLHFIRSEARLFLASLPDYARISSVFILFPDPWPKSRHHKHRLIQPGFLDAIAVRAVPDCNLYFRTDHHPYFTEAKATVSESPHWQLSDAPWPFEFETVFQSRAERHDSLIARRRAG